MENEKNLLDNIDKIHTTELGTKRIGKNLNVAEKDAVRYCTDKICAKNCRIYRLGKNWYCEADDVRITVNAYSYTIITAHIIK